MTAANPRMIGVLGLGAMGVEEAVEGGLREGEQRFLHEGDGTGRALDIRQDGADGAHAVAAGKRSAMSVPV